MNRVMVFMLSGLPSRSTRLLWLGCLAVICTATLLPAPVMANFTHEVAAGDTFWDIAVKYDISLIELLTANGLSEDQILSIGQKLVIPSECDFDYTQVVEHKVKAGECLSIIADKYGVSVEHLCRLNGISSTSAIYIDQVLSIPPQGNSSPEPIIRAPETYTVKAGDSAWAIARKFNVPLKSLLSYNNLKESSILTVGQKLNIPTDGSSQPSDRGLNVKKYTIKPGDCLGIIADKFNVSSIALCNLNGINEDDILRVGQVIRIPVRAGSPGADRPAEKRAPMVINPPEEYHGEPLPPLNVPATNSPLGEAMRSESSVFDFTSRQEEFSITGYFDGNYTYYRIEPGDCISYLADCFDLSVDDICAASNLTDTDYIIPGQIIKLPGECDIFSLNKYKDTYTNSGGKKFTAECLKYLGVDYVYGGEDLKRGVDCSGFIWAIVKRDYGITLPRSAKALSTTKYGIPIKYDALKEGDLIFFHTTRPGISHVGVYLGNGKFIHASSAKDRVATDRLDKGYYKERFIKALRMNFL